MHHGEFPSPPVVHPASAAAQFPDYPDPANMANPTLHVILKKEDLDTQRIAAQVVVVVDTLFATTSIVTALAEGAETVLPALDEHDARAIAATHADPEKILLSGELMAATLPGFCPPTPLALSRHGLAGKTVVYATTNGTVALRKAASAHRVFAGCLRNARATSQHVAGMHDGRTVLVVCAGSSGRFNLEDFYTAGRLVRHLAAHGEFALTDAARVAAGYAGAHGTEVLQDSELARHDGGLWANELAFASEADSVSLVAQLVDNRIVRVN